MGHGHRRRTQRFAEEMRREGTRAERALGRLLNSVDGGRLRGSFVRQWAFDGRWILDVYFWERRVGIEVDGECHRSLAVRRRDLLKERACRERGIVLIRVTNEEVLAGDRAVVLRKLREAWIRAAVRDRA